MMRRRYFNETFQRVIIVVTAAVSAIICTTVLVITPTSVVSQTVGTCYTTINDINIEMQQELDAIANGGIPETSYTYIFCPNSFFDATNVTLVPLLDNIMFLCGDDGSLSNNCVIVGGTEQVRFQNSNITGYPINQVTFMGLTFAGFQNNTSTNIGTSIAAYASLPTVATFTNVAWQQFDSNFVIRQVYDNGNSEPMSIEINDAFVTVGRAGAVFDNDRGLLRINSIQVRNITTASLIATANDGTSFLEEGIIETSRIDSITYTTAGAAQTVVNTQVRSMGFIEDAFFVEDESSTLSISSVLLEQNNPTDASGAGSRWSAIVARTRATASIEDSAISGNSQLEFGIFAFSSAVSIARTSLSDNTGVEPQGTTSAPIFAITDATIDIDQVTLHGNTAFSGEIVALIRSGLAIRQSCFQNGNSNFVVFVANDAIYQQTQNFVDNFTSTRCPAPGPRLFQENADSGCFLGSNQCEGNCLELADQPECRASDRQTSSPTIVTNSPSSSVTSATPVLVTTLIPSGLPTSQPIPITVPPTTSPMTVPTSLSPTVAVTTSPTQRPTNTPTLRPSNNPTTLPSFMPSLEPTVSAAPTLTPQPTLSPTVSAAPTVSPGPSIQPSSIPSLEPSSAPSDIPSGAPSFSPSPSLSFTSSPEPTITAYPTHEGKSSKKKSCKSKKMKSKKGKGKGMGKGMGKGKGEGSAKSSGKGKGKGTSPPPPPSPPPSSKGKGSIPPPPPPPPPGKGKGSIPPPPPGKGKGSIPPPPPPGDDRDYCPGEPSKKSSKSGKDSGKGKGKGKGTTTKTGKGQVVILELGKPAGIEETSVDYNDIGLSDIHVQNDENDIDLGTSGARLKLSLEPPRRLR